MVTKHPRKKAAKRHAEHHVEKPVEKHAGAHEAQHSRKQEVMHHPVPPDLLHDHVMRSGAVAAFALFTLILLLPLSPCKSTAAQPGVSGEVWGVCGGDGWSSMRPGFTLTESQALWLGGIDLTGPERWFVFAGVFGMLYLVYLHIYNQFVKGLHRR